ncbi:hypothetical protein G3N95_23410 [Paraburkholderia sp. Tr-20389]|uniref:HEPN domain-containing protein n=1 Tax=Paraburkholderia sp. Tr-20389 TaxID=2703903 RepID=UPI00197F3E7E|nr:HEPN domain-containing protein [Paraburkholderia sp. Tr-20389]MBN3755913.1 hypothetical protein [Paraburkholderia sp. Tr-20389]
MVSGKRRAKHPTDEEITKPITEKIRALIEPAPENAVGVKIDLPLLIDASKFLTSRSPWQEWATYSEMAIYIYELIRRTVSPPADGVGVASLDSSINAVVAKILAFPKTYTVAFELPAVVAPDLDSIQIAPNVTLVRAEAGKHFPDVLFNKQAAATLLGLAGIRPNPSVAEGKCYLLVATQGLGTTSASSSAIAAATSNVKQILHLCAVHGTGFSQTVVPDVPRQKVEVFAFEHSISPTPFHVDLSDEFQRLLCGVEISDFTAPVGLFGLGGQEVKTGGDALIAALAPYRALLDAADGNQDAQRLRAGLEWGFDAELSGDETQAFIQASIGIEAVLGEDDVEKGMTDKLADRCAYLLATSMQGRRELIASFKSLYKLRSQLVHGRHKRLQPPQRAALFQLRDILTKVLRTETSRFVN